MQAPLKRLARARRRGFTLIELMVVVAVVAILMGAVFQLISVVGKMNKKAETIARLQRVQNAISGFYGAYGYYPPVPSYQSQDPLVERAKNDFEESVASANSEAGFAARSLMACASQPVSFEYPPVQSLDEFINKSYREYRLMSPNTLLAGTAASTPDETWQEIKVFKFGLLSFLLPRVELIGFTGLSAQDDQQEPHINFYRGRQWKKHNPTSEVSDTRKALEAQQALENRTVARWLPNLEKNICHGRTILGVNLLEPHTDGIGLRVKEVWTNGRVTDVRGYEENNQKYTLQYVTVQDGWGNELYYYSPPPYQSYRLWSAGPNGKTFPPWIKIENLPARERAWVATWISDDIVKFDQ
jgi:prepilin-type N-terminal cleavage/methylation domain-containing protein